MEKNDNYYKFSRPEMLKYVPTSTCMLLDIGCGEGNFGKLIKDNIPDCQVWGIDTNIDSIKVAMHTLDYARYEGAETWIGTLYDRIFDCVVFNDSLEHFAYPIDILEDIRKYALSKDGVIVASIPNVRYFPVLKDLIFNRNWEYKESGILDYTHLRFFTMNSIKTMFEQAGYEVTCIEGINQSESLVKEAEDLGKLLNTDLSDTCYLQFAVVARVKED